MCRNHSIGRLGGRTQKSVYPVAVAAIMAAPDDRCRAPARSRPIRHALTIDVEDYYNVFARDRLGVDEPLSPAVVANTGRLLEWLGSGGLDSPSYRS